jgi:hypothetical protein
LQELVAVRFARLNIFVACLQLATFLLVQTDVPISQTRETAAAMTGDRCMMHCCCALEKQAQGTCCCSSKRTTAKSGCLLRSSRCGEDGRTSDAPIVVKFQVVLPVLTVAVETSAADGVHQFRASGCETMAAWILQKSGQIAGT